MEPISKQPKVTQISKDAFKSAMEKARDNGFLCLLPGASKRLGEPFYARVRLLSMDEKAATNGITTEMQDQVWRRTRDYAAWQVELAEKRKSRETADMIEAARNEPRLKGAVDVVCVAGFIYPRLTEDEAAATLDPDLWHVDSIPFADRFHVFQAITDADSQEARRLTLFRPEPTGDVSDQPAGTVSQETQRDIPTDGAAVIAYSGSR